jgi:DNA-binding transcriptional ArsR family regulator
MESMQAVQSLSALAHEGRLSIFRLLVVAGPAGLTVGEIAKKTKMPGATLSFHLSQLKHAGLVLARRDGRRLIQTANFDIMNGLVSYLTENCCGGAATCQPVCAPKAVSSRRTMSKKAG